LKPEDLKRLRNFQFASKLLVQGLYHGRHRSPYQEFSSEFVDYRQYVPGDEIRRIDWRAYARTDRYYVKISRKETDMNCYVLVDKSGSMGFRGGAALSKLEYASFLAASLSYLIVQQGDKVSLGMGDTQLRSYTPGGGTQQHLQHILALLESAKPAGETGLANTLKGYFGMARRVGMLVVISDFLDEPQDLYSALSMYVHRGFAVLLLHVLTDDEVNLPGSGSSRYVDMETDGTAEADPDAIRAAYRAQIETYLSEMRSGAKARRIHYQFMTTSTPHQYALETYLTSRTA
jgi:uncharacterized protein (DUF58 family)